MKKKLNRYFREINGKLLVLPRKKRAAVMGDFRGSVSAFLQENPEAAFQEVEAAFGTPDQVAEGFLQSSDFRQTERKLCLKRKIFAAVCIALGILVAAALILGTVYVVDNYHYTHGQWEDSPAMSGVYIPDSSDGEVY